MGPRRLQQNGSDVASQVFALALGLALKGLLQITLPPPSLARGTIRPALGTIQPALGTILPGKFRKVSDRAGTVPAQCRHSTGKFRKVGLIKNTVFLKGATFRNFPALCRQSPALCRQNRAECRQNRAECRQNRDECRQNRAECRPDRAECRPDRAAG